MQSTRPLQQMEPGLVQDWAPTCGWVKLGVSSEGVAQLPPKVVALYSPQRAIVLQLQAVGEILLVQGQQLVSVSHNGGVGWLEAVLQGRHSELSALIVGSTGQCEGPGLVNAAAI